MGSRLVNVRLDGARLRKVRKLREGGLVFSDVVRDAIDQRFDELRSRTARRDVTAILARVFDQYPDPPGLPARSYDVHDRRSASRAIRRKLRRRRP
jgi:hypothetical protein